MNGNSILTSEELDVIVSRAEKAKELDIKKEEQAKIARSYNVPFVTDIRPGADPWYVNCKTLSKPEDIVNWALLNAEEFPKDSLDGKSFKGLLLKMSVQKDWVYIRFMYKGICFWVDIYSFDIRIVINWSSSRHVYGYNGIRSTGLHNVMNTIRPADKVVEYSGGHKMASKFGLFWRAIEE